MTQPAHNSTDPTSRKGWPMHRTPHSRRPKWWQILLVAVAGLMVLMYTAPVWNPIIFPPVKNPQIGTSFSVKRAKELGVDWRANYLAILDDLQIRQLRLMSYWDETEPARGQFDFADLDWQIAEAGKRGAKISLSIGLRQPRWPECHQPSWATSLAGKAWKQALYAQMEAVVKRYENSPTVTTWQLENEGMNNWFGTCGKPDRQRLIEEFSLVRSWSHKPIWMSLSDQHGLPIGQPWPDKFGYSVYRTVWSEKTWPYVGYLTYPTPIWYHRARATLIKLTTGRDIFIHELQMEPWGPRDASQLSLAEQNKSMSLEKLHDNLYFARQIGTRDIYTWGSEWWYWRKTIQNDPTVWDKVKSELEALK